MMLVSSGFYRAGSSGGKTTRASQFWITGGWYGQPLAGQYSFVDITAAEGQWHINIVEVPAGCTLDSIAVGIKAAGSAGAVVRLGVSEFTGVAGATTLVQNAGTIAATAIGAVELALTVPARATPWTAVLIAATQGNAATLPHYEGIYMPPQVPPINHAATGLAYAMSTPGAAGFIMYGATSGAPQGAFTSQTGLFAGNGAPRIMVRGTQS